MDFCTIASGSSGNCTYVGSERTAVLIDVGLSGKKIESGLASVDRHPSELAGILITHEHIDHIAGLGVLARRYHLPIYATQGTVEYLYGMGIRQVGKIDPDLIHIVSADDTFVIGDLTVRPFRTSHDAAQPVAYRIENGTRSVAVATDMGCYDEDTVAHLKHLDGIVLESNHDVNMLEVGPYPYPLKQRILGERGHLSNELAGHLLCDILHDDMKAVLLGHLSAENNYAALALATVCSEITMGDNPYHGDDFDIEVAARYEPSRIFTL